MSCRIHVVGELTGLAPDTHRIPQAVVVKALTLGSSLYVVLARF